MASDKSQFHADGWLVERWDEKKKKWVPARDRIGPLFQATRALARDERSRSSSLRTRIRRCRVTIIMAPYGKAA